VIGLFANITIDIFNNGWAVPVQCDAYHGNAGTMTSERQKAANRANALHSTGPKTQEGKAVVRLNALRHGLLTRDVVLPGEDADAFEDLLNQVRAGLSPVGPIEELLVDRAVNTMWRLGRLARAETALFDWRVRVLKVNQLADQVGSYEVTFPVFPPDITDKAAHTEATEALARAKHERDQDKLFLGRALDADAKEGDTLGKLGRYQRSLERSLFRTLDELRQLQDQRRNRPAPPDFGCRYAGRRRYRMTSFRPIYEERRARPKTSFLRNKAISSCLHRSTSAGSRSYRMCRHGNDACRGFWGHGRMQ
jgi:hypothetical protein